MDNAKFAELAKAHLEAWELECRWCFAIDLQRVKGEVIAQYNFPDAMVLHLLCPRCGAEFSYYAEVWEEDYLKNLIFKLHPELIGQIDQGAFNEITSRAFPEYLDI